MVTDSNALVVEGGAMRGIFSTGVMDAFLLKDFAPFDIHMGVSAGATNLASYLARMYKRNYKVYTQYSLRPDFISWRKFLLGGHLVDLDWLWKTTIQEIRLDLAEIFSRDKGFYVGVTEVETGKAVFLKPNAENLEEAIKASSAIPLFYRKFIELDGTAYVDGGLAAPVPVLEAYRRGAKRIMVLRSRPYSYVMKPGGLGFSRLAFRKYPGLVTAFANRARAYQEALEFMRRPPMGVKVIEVNPPDDFESQRLTKDLATLERDYIRGQEAGRLAMEKMEASVS